MSSYLIIGGLSPISLRGVIPQLLTSTETRRVIVYDDLSRGTTSSAPVLSDPRVSVVVGSTFNEQLLQKTLADNEITHVIDLASLSSPQQESSPVEVARTAMVGFTHVLDAVRHFGAKPRFVLVSREPSAARPLSEHAPPLPGSFIAANSMAVESMLHSYVISYRLPLVVARLSEGILGHDLSRGLSAVFAEGYSGEERAFAAISIGDAARGILTVLNKGVAPEIYNIGGASAVTPTAVAACLDKIDAGSCCSILTVPSIFPIERAQRELGWTLDDIDVCSILRAEVAAAAAAAAAERHPLSRVLLFGADAPTGKRLLHLLQAKSIPVFVGKSKPGSEPVEKVKEELFRVAPSNIIFVGDRNADPAYFDQEPRPARLRENIGANLHAPWILAAMAARVRCHFTYVATRPDEESEEKTSEGVVTHCFARLLDQFKSDHQADYVIPESKATDETLGWIIEHVVVRELV